MTRKTSPAFRSWATGMACLGLYFVLIFVATFQDAPELYPLAGIYFAGFVICMIAMKWEDKRNLKTMLRQIKFEDDVVKLLALMREYKEAGPVPGEEWMAVLEAEHGWTREYCERLLRYCLDNGWIDFTTK